MSIGRAVIVISLVPAAISACTVLLESNPIRAMDALKTKKIAERRLRNLFCFFG
jgi:hypothetical protein